MHELDSLQYSTVWLYVRHSFSHDIVAECKNTKTSEDNMKKLIKKLSALLPALALLVGIGTLNSVCLLYYYQPEVPEEMDAYRR